LDIGASTECAFLGDNVNPRTRRPPRWSLVCALDLGHFGCKLQCSDDEGMSWTELSVPAYPPGEDVPVGDGKKPNPPS
jgi:hypothetical protein